MWYNKYTISTLENIQIELVTYCMKGNIIAIENWNHDVISEP